jgi:hypothetical protein
MQIEQTQWTQGKGWKPAAPGRLGAGAHLVLLFGGADALKEQHHLDELTQAYPNAHLLGGRKLVLKQRIEEEVESVRDVLGDRTVLTGFYLYGEISPFTPGAKCELHNQTMTITTFSEK